MSSLSSALAAALQNDSAISPMITGVTPGRNFDLQDSMLASSPYACFSVADLPFHETPYLGLSDCQQSGQIEIHCMSKSSEQNVKDLADAVRYFLKTTSSVPWNGSTLVLPLCTWRQDSLISEDLSIWTEVITIDFEC